MADFFAAVGIPSAALFNDAGFHAHVDDLAQTGNAFAEHDVKVRLLKRWGNFVFHDLHFGFVANRRLGLFDRASAANIEAHRSVELECVAARGGLGAAKHHANLHANLVDEDHHAVGFLDRGGEFAQGLAHQTGLQAGQGITHFAFQLGLRGERGHGVDHDQIDRAGAHQAVHDLQRLLAGVGLGNQHVLQVHAEVLRILNVQRMLGIDEGAGAALLLHFSHHLQRERGFARAFWAVNLDHPTARQAAYAQSHIQAQRARGDDLNVFNHLALA